MHQETHLISLEPPECSLTARSQGGGHQLVEAAVIRGNKKETLISLQSLKRWDLVHESFPNQTISDYIESKTNKRYQAYSTVYQCHSWLYEGSRDVPPPL